MEMLVHPARPGYAVTCMLVLSAMCLVKSSHTKNDRLTEGMINCKPNESIYLPSVWHGSGPSLTWSETKMTSALSNATSQGEEALGSKWQIMIPEQLLQPSHREWNRLQHALHGNTATTKVPRRTITKTVEDDREEAPEVEVPKGRAAKAKAEPKKGAAKAKADPKKLPKAAAPPKAIIYSEVPGNSV